MVNKLVSGIGVVKLSDEEAAVVLADQKAGAILKAEEDAAQLLVQYKTDRAKGTFDVDGVQLTQGYPTIGDQLDALWKGGDDQAAMKVIVDKVKSDNPKPE